MIIYIGSRRQTHMLRHMRREAHMPAWTARTYAWLFRTARLPAATYIFVGIDRMDAPERRLAAQFYRHINGLGAGWRALNDPAIAMGRYRLLRQLHEAGINDFNAYLVAESARPERYPVLVRRNATSTPPLTGLLESRAALDVEIDRLVAAGEVPEDLVIIEYCAEPTESGLYCKQAEYRIGEHFIPSPSIYAGDWYVKRSTSLAVDDAVTAYDAEVLRTNPFAEVARRVFAIAGIEYGRADIGVVGGRPQIFEINFNPDVRSQRENPERNKILSGLWDDSDKRFFAALHEVDSSGRGSAPTLRTGELTAFRLRFWRNYAPQRF